MVASHTAAPIGAAKWLERATPTHKTLLICKGQVLTMSPTIKAGLYYWGNLRTSHFAVPKGTAVWLATIVRCLWHHSLSDIANACLIVIKLHIRENGDLSNNIRILTPKNRGYWSRKGHSVEKTPFFEVFRKVLADRWLRGYLFVIVWFTKHRIAKGKVSSRERPCFTVWKVMFEAMKHNLWRGQS